MEKDIVYFINYMNTNDPFVENDNDSYIGRITYRKIDVFLYTDDAGQQFFIRFKN